MPVVVFLLMLVGAIIFFSNSEENLEKNIRNVKQSEVVNHTGLYSLTIDVTPSDARVFITNIKPKYHDGIKLKQGFYTIKVVKKGYETQKKSFQLKSNQKIKIILKKLKVITNQKISKGHVWKDNESGLVWQLNISKKTYNWDRAKEYCHNLNFGGYSTWKLPTKKELLTLMTKKSYKNRDSNVGKTHIKKPLLKSMKMEWQTFWSATEEEKNSPNAWNIYFDYGSGEYYDKSNDNYVRCVMVK